MDKKLLDGFIKKYHLNGRVNSVQWDTTGTSVSTLFNSDERDLVGLVTLKDFKFPLAKIGVYDTKALAGGLSVLESDVSLELRQVDNIPFMIKLNDGNTDVSFLLSDLSIISVPKFKTSNLPDWDIKIKIDKNFTSKFIKSISAINDNKFTVVGSNNHTKIIIGYSDIQTNRVAITVDTEVYNDVSPISFSAQSLREILTVNADAPDATLCISSTGLAFIEFDNAEYNCKYYLLALNDAN